MIRSRTRRLLSAITCATTALAMAPTTQADNFNWTGGTGFWNDGFQNWSNTSNFFDLLGFPDDASDTANVGTATFGANLETNTTIGNLNITGNGQVSTSSNILTVVFSTQINGAGADLNVSESGALIDFNAGNIFLSNGGGLNLSGDSEVQYSGSVSVGAGSSIFGNGEMRNTGNFTTFNNGTIVASGGTLQFLQPAGFGSIDLDGSSESGALSVNSGATLQIDSPLLDSTFNGNINIFSNGTLNIANDWIYDNSFSPLNMLGNNATTTISGGKLLNRETISVQTAGGTSVINSSSYEQTTGSLLSVVSNATARFNGPATFFFGSDISLGTNSQLIFNNNADIFDATTLSFGFASTLRILNGTTTISDASNDFDWDGPGDVNTIIDANGKLFITTQEVDLGNDTYNGTIIVRGGISSDGQLNVNVADNEWVSAGSLFVEGGLITGDAIRVTGLLHARNAGVNSSAGQIYAPLTLASSSTLDVDFGNQLILNGNTTIQAGATANSIDGILQFDGPTTTVSNTLINGSGTLRNNSNTTIDANATWQTNFVDLDGSSETGTINVNSGRSLTVNADLSDNFDSTFNLNSGSLAVNDPSGFWNMFGTLNMSGPTELAGSRMVINNTDNSEGLRANSGVATVTADVDVEADGDVVIAANATLRFLGETNIKGGRVELGDNATLEFSGPTSITQASALAFFQNSELLISSGTTHLNNPTDIFNWDGGGYGSETTIVEAGASLIIDVQRVDANDDRHDATITVKGTNGGLDGVLDVNVADSEWQANGTLNLEGGIINGDTISLTGIMNVQNAGTEGFAGIINADLHVDNGGSVVIKPGQTLSLEGAARFEQGSYINNMDGTLELRGGATFNGPNVNGSGMIYNNGSTIYADTAWNVGIVDLDGDGVSSDPTTVENGVSFTINSSLTPADAFDSILTLEPLAVLNMNLSDPVWDLAGTLNLNHSSLVNGTKLRVYASASGEGIHVDGTATINAPLEIFSNARISLPDFGDVLVLTGPTSFASADYDIGNGQIQFGNDFEVADGAILRTNLVNVAGTFMPGNSPGSVTVDSYEQATDGRIIMELAGETPGSEHDHLSSFGSLDLDGKIVLDLINGYKPTPYTEHTLITANGVMFGQFATVDGITQPGVAIGQGLAVTYDYANQEVLVQAALLGDLTLDQIVNIGDLTILAPNFGLTTATWADGDFTGDGLVGIGDLTILAGNFGSSVISPSPTTVPEPASIPLLLTGLILVRRSQR